MDIGAGGTIKPACNALSAFCIDLLGFLAVTNSLCCAELVGETLTSLIEANGARTSKGVHYQQGKGGSDEGKAREERRRWARIRRFHEQEATRKNVAQQSTLHRNCSRDRAAKAKARVQRALAAQWTEVFVVSELKRRLQNCPEGV